VDRHPAPAGADLQQVVLGPELQPVADPVELRQLRLLEARVVAREVGAGIHHPLVEEAGEEVVAEVVVGGDVGAGAVPGVLGDEAAQPVQEPARAGDGGADPVHLAQFAGGDPDQVDEVVGFPEALDIGLAEADAAAQRAAPGGGVVDPHRCPQLRLRGTEAALPRAFDDVDPPRADPAQHGADGGPRERVPHGERNPFGRLPSGWG
jgi:hypothetical protein